MYQLEYKLIKFLESEKETILSFSSPLEVIQKLFELATQWASEELKKKIN